MEPMSIFNMQSNAIRDSALEELSGILEAHDDSGRGIYPESLGMANIEGFFIVLNGFA